MRIAIPTFVMQGNQTGISTYLCSLLNELQTIDTNNEYFLIAPRKDAHLLPKGKRMHQILTPNWISHPLLNILFHHLILPFWLWKHNIDLLHIPSIRRIPFFKSCSMIATVHDLAPIEFPKKYGFFRYVYHRYFLLRLIFRSEWIITVSNTTKQQLVKLTGYPQEKISTIYLGVNRSKFHPHQHEKNPLPYPYLFFPSRIEHPAKNHIMLIKAFQGLITEMPHHLLFAGADWNGAEEVKKYVNFAGLSDRVHFLGFVDDKEFTRLLSSASLMIFPSLFEGFGLPLIEAMATKVPVACSDIPIFREIANSHAIFFNPRKIDSIQQGIRSGLKVPEEKLHDALLYSHKFNWKSTAEHTLAIYDRFNSE